ncbi:T9SS type A sorting domain-containing protein [Psychroflexus halocasei]|uniref:Por secretion system C-terminal sorting domain-containing protein n=1 Tax=Psychroflexus halocasei TaxID=908615 RepID=A0A1H3ZUG1_9FLAO|nr:T9SS type A sorting domain-containing protein [Psychroflexus halocasei]SEA26914.1 Por secretion system C-terminal sorting domain-containing protein [Psychroflexus halocasei]
MAPSNPDSYEISADLYFDSSSNGGEIDFYIYGEMGTEALPGAAMAISDERLLIVEMSDFSTAVDMQIENDMFHNLKMAFDFVNQETLYYLNGDLLYTGSLNLSEFTGYGFLKTSNGKGYADNIVTSENTLKTNQIDKGDFIHYVNQNNLHLQNNSSLKNILIYNILGQEVISKNLNSKKERIYIESLKSGVYIAKVSTDQSTKTFKFIKKD